MKKLFKILGTFFLALALLVAGLKLTGNGYLVRGMWACYLHGNNSATINDLRFFNSHKIEAAKSVWQWPVNSDYNKQPLPEKLKNVLAETGTVAFLVIQNDSIVHEHYWDNYSDSSLSNSFSMAKSITTMLAEIAIQKGALKDWHQKVKTILPDLKGPHADELELWHLSTMSSGLEWDEAYKNPFTVTAKAYYGEDVKNLMMTLPIIDKPGQFYNYQSGSTQLLALCVMKATGKPLAELASDWLWKPLQAEHEAQWHTDSKGTELAYCCFNTNARDFARFGLLMLHHGNWNGVQVLDSSFVEMAIQPAFVPYYGYSFWLTDTFGTKVFAQRGILGQYIITIPEYNLVIVRLGKHCLPKVGPHNGDFLVIVQQVLAMYRKEKPVV